MTPLLSINPSNGMVIKSYPQYSYERITKILNHAAEAQNNWKNTNLKFRLERIKQLSEIVSERKIEYASLMAQEMGKPLKQGIGEIEKCIWLCNYYILNSDEFLKDKTIETDGQKSFVTIQPIGLVLGIMPWNFPFWQVFRFAIPCLISGNGAI